MGCNNTKKTEVKNDSQLGDKSPQEDAKIVNSDHISNSILLDESASKELTPRQKELILETWKLLVENISSVGVITFMSLFETHPDVQDVFMPFKGLSKEELRHSKELRAHGLRVMGFVQKVVARLDEPTKSEQLLKDLGRNHVMYGAKVEYVDLIGPQFVYAVKPPMKEHWSEEIEEAWMQLFRYMAYVMKKAMIDCTKPSNVQNVATTAEKENHQKKEHLEDS